MTEAHARVTQRQSETHQVVRFPEMRRPAHVLASLCACSFVFVVCACASAAPCTHAVLIMGAVLIPRVCDREGHIGGTMLAL